MLSVQFAEFVAAATATRWDHGLNYRRLVVWLANLDIPK